MITKIQKELIAIKIIEVLYRQIINITKAVHPSKVKLYSNAFINSLSESKSEEINLKSWARTLSLDLGQSFFEQTAYILSNSNRKDFKGNKISELQQAQVSRIITELQNSRGDVKPNLQTENERIWSVNYSAEDYAHDFTVDIFWEDDSEVVAIEAKTVRPNSDISKQTKSKILQAKCVLKNLYPNKEIKYFYGFPFDPYGLNPTNSDKNEFMRKNVNFSKYFAEDEVLLASEFWDYISGTSQTMETILTIINSIATVKFMEKFAFLQNKQMSVTNKYDYIQVLKDWFLFREVQVVEGENSLRLKTAGNRGLTRTFHQDLFNSKGEYNETRVSMLLSLLEDLK